jgi:galactonate dehydratase
MAEWFTGKPTDDLKGLVRGFYDRSFYHGGGVYMSALAGIEMALWDIAGKAANLPVYRLLGGRVRDRVKVYRWAGGNNNAPQAAAEEAARVVAEGARAIKMNACPPLAAIDTYGGIRAAVERARAVRDAVGEEVDIAFDFHGRANVPMARRLARELEFANPLFYEEPVRPEYNRWLGEVAAITHVPIATGERMTTVAEFSDVLASRAAHILQPDVAHVGGIANTAEVAALCEANGVALAPHCPLSPVAFMACLHVVVQSRAGWILEWSKGIHYNAHGATGEIDPWLRYVDPRRLAAVRARCGRAHGRARGPGTGRSHRLGGSAEGRRHGRELERRGDAPARRDPRKLVEQAAAIPDSTLGGRYPA